MSKFEMKRVLACACLIVGCGLCAPSGAAAQQPGAPAPRQAPVEKLGNNLFRVGNIRVDTAKREISVPGSVNDVSVLEFVANTKGGMKAYESALTIETDAVTFNLALVLIGLDKAHGKAPTRHFDPTGPVGDPVEITVEVLGGDKARDPFPAEHLLFDRKTNQVVPGGGWVYTGSTFVDGNRYMAEMDGTLIGFVHSPSPIIEYAPGAGIGSYGSIVLNPSLGLAPRTSVMLRVRAIGERGGSGRK